MSNCTAWSKSIWSTGRDACDRVPASRGGEAPIHPDPITIVNEHFRKQPFSTAKQRQSIAKPVNHQTPTVKTIQGFSHENTQQNTNGLLDTNLGRTENPNGSLDHVEDSDSSDSTPANVNDTTQQGYLNGICPHTAARRPLSAYTNGDSANVLLDEAPIDGINRTTVPDIPQMVPAIASSSPGGLEPLAIVGMAFQFPSGAVTESAFWDMLTSQTCASSEFPADRMNIDAFYNADKSKPNAIHTRNAHFLDHDIRRFDAHHFNIPASEAGAMDPNQRGLMETTYHALENAGIPVPSLAGTRTSVHVGFFSSDHMTFNLRDSQRIPKYYATGSSSSILSNRISWYFDLRGPSMTIDTACSSGMVAMDLACQGLWAGTSDMAIVGAANLILSPELNIALCNMNFLSPDGKCYSFDNRASGYARGEGFSAMILKPLSKALAAGDNIRALVRSIGSNQDGYTPGGITQPSREMQTKLIRETYAKADLDMRETRFFEAHGTGTSVGDPTEARAIGESFRPHRTDDEPLYVGAVKSNVGHLEGASALAGVVKAVLALEKGIIPPNTNFETLNPGIDDEFLRLKFPQKSIPWPKCGVRRASVNSFGFGGANAHVVLDDALSYLQSRKLEESQFRVLADGHAVSGHASNGNAVNKHTISGNAANGNVINGHAVNGHLENGNTHDNGVCEEMHEQLSSHKMATFTPKLFILSSSSEAGVAAQIDTHSTYLEQFEPSSLPSYAYTLATRRTLLPWRSFGIINSLNQLSNFPSLVSKPVQSLGTDLKLGFVFTGQGAQWFDMGRELLSDPVFMSSIQESQACLESLGCTWSLVERLTDEKHASSIGEAQFSQTITTGVQLALFDLVTWMGILPSVLVGHSSGEIAAAYAAGHVSRASAVRISYYRGLLGSKLEKTCSTRWSMAAVGLSRKDATREIAALEADHTFGIEAGSLIISCINSPISVTVSGPVVQLDILVEHMADKHVFARKLKVGLGYHSPQMAAISTEYLSLLAHLEPAYPQSAARPVMVSSVTGDIVSSATVCTGKYWVRNMVSPVDFVSALQFCHTLSRLGESHSRLEIDSKTQMRTDGWLEIGPHAALKGPIRETLQSLSRENEVVYTSALIRNKSAISSILAAAAELHCRAFSVNMTNTISLGLSASQKKFLRVLPNLPKYQFDHSSLFWEEPQQNKSFRFRKHGNHDLLGTMISEPNALESQWKLIIKEDDMPWIRDHKVDGLILYPAAGMIVMAIEAAKQLLEDDLPAAFELRDVEFPAPIIITSAPEGVEVRIHMSSNAKNNKGEADYKFRLFLYRINGTHDVICTGNLRGDYNATPPGFVDGNEISGRAARVKSDIESTLANSKQSLGSDEMYDMIRTQTTIDYGPVFQVLEDIRCDGFGRAVASILPQSLDSTTAHTVHPSRLDGIFQLVFAAVGAMQKAKTMVPTMLSRLWLPLRGFGHSNATQEKAFAELREISDHGVTFDIKVVNGFDDKILVEIDGLETTAVVSNAAAATTLEDVPYLCSHMEWKADIDALNQKEMQEYCDAARVESTEPVEYFQYMDALALNYGAKALAELARQGKSVAPNMRKYADWLEVQVNASSHVRILSDDELERLCASVRHTVRGELHMNIGENLVQFLSGEANPLEVIFADEAKITEFYRELTEDTTGLEPFNRYLDAVVHKTPDLRFLEVGAGTGGSTSVMMRTIGDPELPPRFEEYLYTDISPSFFVHAQSRFSQHNARMRYQVLNVERDTEEQGFEGNYDVIIADNVLHATHDLHITLSNIRKLLRPGGRLILKELVTPKRMLTGFSFGLLPGWWLSSEAEKEMSPLLSEERWHTLLKDSGFTGIDLKFRDHLRPEAHLWSIMVSTAASPSGTISTLEMETEMSPFFVLDCASALQRSLSRSVAYALGFSKDPATMTLAEASGLCSAEPNQHSFIFLNEMNGSVLRDVHEEDFISLQKFLAGARAIVWAKQGGGTKCISIPDYGISDGLCRVARRENNNVVVSVALETAKGFSTKNLAKAFRLMHEAVRLGVVNYESEYIEMEGRLCVGRMRRVRALDEHLFKRTAQPVLHQKIGDSNLRLGIRARGLLDTIQFHEDTMLDKVRGASEVDVEVHAIGVNYKDCLTLLGKINSDHFGSECSGIVRAVGRDVEHLAVGDRVLVGDLGVFRTYVRVPAGAVLRIPNSMKFAEAASIFTAYCTAYYSLVMVARLQRGESILIHAAAGGTGQAMVQVAQYIGAKVYVTVGSSPKKDLLVDVYGIPSDHVFYSRDASFADGIKRMTGDRGVDVVVNSQQGRLLEASWECIAIFGRFIDIGLKDAFLRGHLPMHVFTRNVSYSGINLNMLVEHDTIKSRAIMTEVLRLFVEGKLKAVTPLHRYPLHEVEKALRFLQSGKSAGKIVLEVERSASVPVSLTLVFLLANTHNP
jgi:acyl transferase domain-containing protein/NADPH:quinone reductase-like Zn-dependent oxidoreductase/SAM-dependent methyltransferase